MTESEPSRAVLAAEGLTLSLGTLTDQVGDLRRDNKRHRFLIRCLGVSVAFDLLLSVALGFIGVTAHSASTKASDASAATVVNQRATCLSANEARRVNTDLWNYVLSVREPVEGEDPARVEQFKAYVTDAFRQKECP